MSQGEKAAYYQALKSAGVEFSKPYRNYTTAELKEAYEKLTDGQPQLPPEPGAPPSQPPPQSDPPPGFDPEAMNQAYQNLVGQPQHQPPSPPQPQPQPQPPAAPVAQRDPEEMAGQRTNSQPADQPIRVDEQGRAWYQEEIQKPSYPKPRGRRVLKYSDPGVEQQQVKVGNYIETFEVAGRGAPRESEVRITLPSYQVGIYKDPRFPFRVHCYNGVEGFDLFEVQNYYGGAELVPAEIKRMYVENVLCYDIRTTVRAIMSEYRQLQLTGKIKE